MTGIDVTAIVNALDNLTVMTDENGNETFDQDDLLNCLVDEDCINLSENNSELLNKVAEKLKAQFKDMQFHTGRAWFDFDAAIDRCCEKVDKVIADIKSEAFNEG